MKALVKVKKGDGFLELCEREAPVPCEGEVLIRVAYGGICGTDIHIRHDEFAYYPPVILGHEFSGEIIALGKGVTSFNVGDRVVGEPHNLACGKCYLCRNGHIQNCNHKRSIGWGIDGCFTSLLVMPEHLLHKIPDNVSLKSAAMAEPAAIVAHQLLERARITAGDNVVIMGVGPIALLAAQMARISGAGKIILCGCTSDIAHRLKIAKELDCFDIFIDVLKEDAAEIIMRETGAGADIVVEASGAVSAIALGIHILKKRGLFCAIGMTKAADIPIPWNEAMMKVLDLQFNMSSSYNGWDIALKLMGSGRLNTELMTEVMPLESWETAFDRLEKGEAMKILLTMDEV